MKFIELISNRGKALVAIRRIDSVQPGDEAGCVVFVDGDIAGVHYANAYMDIRDLLLAE